MRPVLASLLLGAGLAGFLALPAAAGDDRRPSAEEIVRQLSGAAAPRPARRGISVEDAADTVQESRSIDLEINFEYNSARLTPDARLVLDNLGRALATNALAGSRFRIVGHTDGKGNVGYNLRLSRQRAEAVAAYLAREYDIAGQRLTVEGMGSTRLLDPARPDAAFNRRVQVVNIGS